MLTEPPKIKYEPLPAYMSQTPVFIAGLLVTARLQTTSPELLLYFTPNHTIGRSLRNNSQSISSRRGTRQGAGKRHRTGQPNLGTSQPPPGGRDRNFSFR